MNLLSPEEDITFVGTRTARFKCVRCGNIYLNLRFILKHKCKVKGEVIETQLRK